MRIYRAASLAFGTALLLSCERPEPRGKAVDAIASRDTLSPVAGAVLPIEKGPVLTRACTRHGRNGIVDYFVPTQNEIAALEARLPAALEAQRQRTGPPVADYYRQYIGIIRSGERRAVYVNAFPRSHLKRLNDLLPRLPGAMNTDADSVAWRRDPILVCDGGRAYWSVEFDLSTAAFYRFEHNEPA
jgi:hypothetical protein